MKPPNNFERDKRKIAQGVSVFWKLLSQEAGKVWSSSSSKKGLGKFRGNRSVTGIERLGKHVFLLY